MVRDSETEQESILGVVLPFLKSIGFAPDEIRAEQSFSLRLGHYVYRVDTEEQVRRAAPRLDILVTRNNKNIFLVEVKRSGAPLTEQDRDQAISYARVIHPIAPFVILTNGGTTKLFNTLSREEILPSSFIVKEDYELEITLEQEHRFILEFIGYSATNVQAFSRAQVAGRTRPLVGKIADISAKYIPELYEPRCHLESVLRDFFKSDCPGIVILGDSGAGKTSALCHLALSLAGSDSPLFFYRGFELTSGILNAVASDFNWQFSQQYSEIEVVKRLLTLQVEGPIIFILDAVDEWTFSGKVPSLLHFIDRIPGKRVKLVMSCKTVAWPQFVVHRGASTGLEDFLYVCGGHTYFNLQPMDSEEFDRAFRRYKEAFQFRGYFEDRLLSEMERSPFLMGIAFEVASKREDERLTLSNLDLLTSYYESSLKKVGNSNSERWSAQHVLDKLAQAIFVNNQSSVSKSALRNLLGGSLDENALSELIEFNIIEIEVEDGEERLGFYFSRLRDYIIAFRFRKWHKLSAPDFAEEVAKLHSDGVHQEVLIFFYPLAEEQKRELIDGPLRHRAGEYLELYCQILQEHFCVIRHRFAPFTMAQIGFIGQLIVPLRDMGFIGFREIKKGEDEIFFIPYSRYENSSNVPDLYGGIDMHGFGQAFLDLDWERAVTKHEIGGQLGTIVRRGLLDESQNPELLAEIIPAMVHDQRGRFKTYGSPLFRDLFPMSLAKMQEGLQISDLEEYYRDKKADEKIARGELGESGYSYPDDFSIEDLESIRANVEAAMLAGKEATFGWGRTPADEIKQRFLEAKSELSARGIEIIDAPVVNQDFLSAISGAAIKPIDFIREKFVELYGKFIANYVVLVKRNFPTLGHRFALYGILPATFFVNIEKPPYYGRGDYELTIITCKGKGLDGEVLYFSREEVSADEVWRRSSQLLYKGNRFEVVNSFRGGLRHFCHSGRYVDFQMSSSHLQLRGLVYRQKKELPNILKNLVQIYCPNREVIE